MIDQVQLMARLIRSLWVYIERSTTDRGGEYQSLKTQVLPYLSDTVPSADIDWTNRAGE